jgi:phosphoglycolate phosphatase-like HAD superfamily hydrolase
VTYSWLNPGDPHVYKINTSEIADLKCERNLVVVTNKNGDELQRKFHSISEASVFHGTLLDDLSGPKPEPKKTVRI